MFNAGLSEGPEGFNQMEQECKGGHQMISPNLKEAMEKEPLEQEPLEKEQQEQELPGSTLCNPQPENQKARS